MLFNRLHHLKKTCWLLSLDQAGVKKQHVARKRLYKISSKHKTNTSVKTSQGCSYQNMAKHVLTGIKHTKWKKWLYVATSLAHDDHEECALEENWLNVPPSLTHDDDDDVIEEIPSMVEQTVEYKKYDLHMLHSLEPSALWEMSILHRPGATVVCCCEIKLFVLLPVTVMKNDNFIDANLIFMTTMMQLAPSDIALLIYDNLAHGWMMKVFNYYRLPIMQVAW